jgi:hypothetical protein
VPERGCLRNLLGGQTIGSRKHGDGMFIFRNNIRITGIYFCKALMSYELTNDIFRDVILWKMFLSHIFE